ncbi:MAG: AMP-binding protein [Acidimicrobiia bacterium]
MTVDAAALLELEPDEQRYLLDMLQRAYQPTHGVPSGAVPPGVLSDEQRQIWLVERTVDAGSAYNISVAVRLKGSFDEDRLARAVASTIDHHPALTTVFAAATDGEPVARAGTRAERTIVAVEISASDEQAALGEATAFVAQSFDLAVGPLIRARVWRISTDHGLLVIAAHHIVCDGASFEVLLHDVARRYEERTESAYLDGNSGPRSADTAAVERIAAEHATIPPFLDLPGDAQPGADRTFEGGAVHRRFPGDLERRLRQVAEELAVTLSSLALAGFAALLYRYTGREQFAVGVPFSTRRTAADAGRVGLYVNSLPVPFDCTVDMSFAVLARTAHRKLAERIALAPTVPFAALVERVNPPRHPTRNPLFQVEFAFQSRLGLPTTMGGASLDPVPIPSGASKFDLSLDVIETSDGLTASFEFATSLFSEDRIDRMVDHYLGLLHHFADAPGQTLGTPPLLSASEAEWAEKAGGLTAAAAYDRHEPLLARLRRHVRRTPDSVAVLDDRESITFGDLICRAEAAASALARAGVRQGQRVALFLPRSAQAVVFVLGAWLRGAAFVPIDADTPPRRVEHILDLARPAAIVVDDDTATRIAARSEPLVPVSGLMLDSYGSPPFGSVESGDAAYLIFTSGTTGAPKGVEVTHRALETMTTAWASEYGLEAQPARYLQLARISFDIFVGDLCRSFLCGGTLVVCPDETITDPERLLALIESARVDTVEFVPALLRFVLDYLAAKGRRLPALQRLVVGSDMWSVDDARRMLEAVPPGTRCFCSYGTTEAAIDSTYSELDGDALPRHGPVPIGRPFPGVGIRVLDVAGHDCPIGIPGELVIAGPTVSDGYLFGAGARDRRFHTSEVVPGFSEVRTGDRAYWLKSGELVCLGRDDDLIKIQGARVDPVEVERVLRAVRSVADAAAVAIGLPGDQELVAVLVAADGAMDPVAETKRELSETLPRSAVPTRWLVTERLPTTPNGKLDRPAVRALAEAGNEPVGTVAPRTALERSLHEIWSSVLPGRYFGVTENFFVIGGRSLLAARCAWRIRDTLGLDASTADIFHAQTIEALAERLVRPGRAKEVALARPVLSLPVEIGFSGSTVPVRERRRVLLTGATGLVGSAIARSLGDAGIAVTHLVRADTTEEAARQLRASEAGRPGRLDIVIGDLSRPLLGLDSNRFGVLAASVDGVVNAAAWVSFVLPYEELAPTNVGGVVELLRLCGSDQGRILPLVQVSTASAARAGDAAPAGGYNATKWDADFLIKQAAALGLPATIIQPGFVVDPGRPRTTDLLWAFLATCCQTGMAPRMNGRLNLVPAGRLGDMAAAAIGGTLGSGVWVAAHPHPARWSDVYRALARAGWPLTIVEPDTWRGSVEEPGLPIEPFLTLLDKVPIDELLEDDDLHTHPLAAPADGVWQPVVDLVVDSVAALQPMARAPGQPTTATRPHTVVDAVGALLVDFEERNRPVNSIVVHDPVRVIAEAAALDRIPLEDRASMPLFGVPITVKESIDVVGYPSTAGDPHVCGDATATDAPSVLRLKAAGAVIIGKTNVAYLLEDWQARNPRYGVTSNPYDHRHTAGGSSGGAAAVALRLSAGDLGSDLIGSLRVPGAFCGVFAHRATDGALSRAGEGRIVPRDLPGSVLGSQGFAAASTSILTTLLEVAGAGSIHKPDPVSWLSSRDRLSGLRLAVLPELAWLPLSAATRAAVELAAARAADLGARVVEAAPPRWGEEHIAVTCSLLGALTLARRPAAERNAMVEALAARRAPFDADWRRGITASVMDYFVWLSLREIIREGYAEFFAEHDLLLAPITLGTAFGHMADTSLWPTGEASQPTLSINGTAVPYGWQLIYPSIASLPGLPATAFPVMMDSGLPVGLQVIGPEGGDFASIELAGRLSDAGSPAAAG